MRAFRREHVWTLLLSLSFLAAMTLSRRARALEPREPLPLATRSGTELALTLRGQSFPAMTEVMLSLAVPLERAVSPQVRGTAALTHLRVDTRWVQRLILAAWAAAGIGESDDRLSSLATRARISSLLPEARVRLLRTDAARATYEVSDDGTVPLGTQQVGYTWEGRLTWRLDRLLFAEEELGIERLRNEHRESRDKLRHRVLEAYFLYRRADADLRVAIEGSREAWESKLKLEEAVVTLDALTAGYFTRYGEGSTSAPPASH